MFHEPQKPVLCTCRPLRHGAKHPYQQTYENFLHLFKKEKAESFENMYVDKRKLGCCIMLEQLALLELKFDPAPFVR